jgi:hypothetical protein
VALSPGNSFSAVTVTDCNLSGGNSLEWFNHHAANSGAGAWQAVTPAPHCDGRSSAVCVRNPELEQQSDAGPARRRCICGVIPNTSSDTHPDADAYTHSHDWLLSCGPRQRHLQLR